MRNVQAWSEDEFGHAELGDTRRERRLVQIGVETAGCPSGVVSKACRSQASQVGAFRFLENGAVHVDGIRSSIVTATVRRCSGQQVVVVPVDGSSLSIQDRRNQKGLGAVGARNQGAKGIQTMTALAVSQAGATIGVCAQRMWVRTKRSPHGARGTARGRKSENDYWLETLLDVRDKFGADASSSRPWFQMDRGADCWQVLEAVVREGMLATVRAAHDRRVDEELGRLWTAVEAHAVVAKLKVAVPARPATFKKKKVKGKSVSVRVKARAARVARVSLRAATVTLQCTLPTGAVIPVTINAVLAKEARGGDHHIEWMLLTTHPIKTRRNVLAIVRAYTLRWRIEDFHRTWKRGLCRVEDTQLRSRDAIFKWATILATVATRALRLAQLARTTPKAAASSEFSDVELKAIVALRKPRDFDPRKVIDLATAVRWLADLGGYSRPRQGPPGPTVIGRGLYDVLVVARALENLDQMR